MAKANNTNNQTKQRNKGMAVVLIILFFLLGAVLAALIIFWLYGSRVQKETAMQSQSASVPVGNLGGNESTNQQQVSTSGEQASATSSASVTNPQNKPVLNSANHQAFQSRLDNSSFSIQLEGGPINSDPADTKVNFEDKILGLSAKIPFNVNWGNDRVAESPYDVYATTHSHKSSNGTVVGVPAVQISFGPFGIFEGGGLVRPYSIQVIAKRDLNAIKKEVTDLNDPQLIIKAPFLDQVSGQQVVKYKVSGFCGQATVEVLGDKFNYVVQGLCDSGFAAAEDIVSDMKLL